MKFLPYLSIFFLFAWMLCFTACKVEEVPTPDTEKEKEKDPEIDPDPDPTISTYTGTARHTRTTTRFFPGSGRDSVISWTDTFPETFSLTMINALTFEVVAFESGCDLAYCCFQGPCPGSQFTLSEALKTSSYWDEGKKVYLGFHFFSDTSQVEMNYTYSDGYWTIVTDDSTGQDLYHEIRTATYTFKGSR